MPTLFASCALKGRILLVAFGLLPLACALALPGHAQSRDDNGWSTGVQTAPSTGLTTTVIPRQPPAASTIAPGQARLHLVAYLTAEIDSVNRRAIDRGLVWRVFALGAQDQNSKLIETLRTPSPTLTLPPGRYAINAAFGRAHLTQIVQLHAGRQKTEPFVLNAGGLRVRVNVAGGQTLAAAKARYDIFSDERDQSGARRRVVSSARPGLITRLNSGIYHIVSQLGDANARVSAEVAVEAGKLTEAVVSHEAAKVTLKLVESESGEAQADTVWIIMTRSGDVIKETAGALPTHVLAPGSYSVSARRDGQLYTRTFDLRSGDNVEVEVMMQ